MFKLLYYLLSWDRCSTGTFDVIYVRDDLKAIGFIVDPACYKLPAIRNYNWIIILI